MTIQWTISGLTTLVAAGLSGTVLVLLWNRRVLPEARVMWPIMAVITLWSLITALEAMTPDVQPKIILSTLEHVCVGLVGPLLVLFALRFSGRLPGPASTRLRLVLFLPPLVNYLFVATNAWHHLVWRSFSPGVPGTLVLVYHHGPMYYVIVATAYLYFAYATARIIRSVREATISRRQAVAVTAAMLLPWAASVLYMTRAVPLDRFTGFMPLGFAGTALILAWSLLPSRPLSLMPVARDSLFALLPDGVITLDARGRVADTNAAARRFLGLGPSDLGRAAHEALGRWPELGPLLRDAEATRSTVRLEDNGRRTLDVVKEPIRIAHWERGQLLMLHDVSQRVAMEDALRLSEQRYKDLVENALVGVYVTTQDGRISYANEVMWRLFGYESAQAFRQVDVAELYRHAWQREELLEVLAREGFATNHEVEMVTKQGEPRWVSITASLVGDRISGMILDVTQRRISEALLRESEERFRMLVERLADAVFITDDAGHIQHANPAAVHQTGYSLEELGQLDILEDLAMGSPGIDPAAAVAALNREEVVRFEERKRRKDGTLYWTECALSRMDVHGESMVLSVNRDITARKEAEARLQYLSTHDPLTGAYNRGYFDEELARLGRGRRFPVSILVVDVNGLKQVNDTDGHAAGDQVLRCTYEVLGNGVRGEDVVARIGGDEFAILLPETEEAAVKTVIGRIRDQMEKHNCLPIPHRPISLAIGAATVMPHEPMDDGLRLADARMYEDKRGSEPREADQGD